MVAVEVAPLTVAVMVAPPLLEIVPAVAVNVPVVELAATVTEAGMVRLALLDDRDTVVPPVGAALDKVTVHVLVALEVRVLGEH
jgi:hypothetical protein